MPVLNSAKATRCNPCPLASAAKGWDRSAELAENYSARASVSGSRRRVNISPSIQSLAEIRAVSATAPCAVFALLLKKLTLRHAHEEIVLLLLFPGASVRTGKYRSRNQLQVAVACRLRDLYLRHGEERLIRLDASARIVCCGIVLSLLCTGKLSARHFGAA